MVEKTRQSSGADEKTPSIPQYFSWINNTNEGSTEAQTLVNLEYFKWLHDYYGMKIRIYAWDAGNLDGASGTYEKLDGPKLKGQFPNGYAPMAAKAAEFGAHLGVWGGADGFGDTPEEEKQRFDQMVSLCKDYGFMLFKFDTVCGSLRKEKRQTFKNMIDECRKYSPELIVLNHRNDLGEVEICATTFLWGGMETYVDIFMVNRVTAMHHREGPFERGLVPDLKRLTEDHGVCISSCLDYFEDDLILQAFNRSLILAPEMYGNPWLLRDDEQAELARIYNLHAQFADILTAGMVLPPSYGKYAVSRGNGKIRLLTLRNASWSDINVKVELGDAIGLDKCERVIPVKYHPFEKCYGVFDYGSVIDVTVPAFRAVLLAVYADGAIPADAVILTNCEYKTIRHKAGEKAAINILKSDGGKIEKLNPNGISETVIENLAALNLIPDSPVFLGEAEKIDVPENAEQLYEATMFNVSNDSLESQSLKRSGDTQITQVKAARDAFFAQKTYVYRGCESKSLFDGDSETYFDANSRYYGTRIDGGCLRIDFGEVYSADTVEIEYFKIDSPVREVLEQLLPTEGEFSADLKTWVKAPLAENAVLGNCTANIVKHSVHNIETADGKRMKAVYSATSGAAGFRYFRLAAPMDRIYAVKLLGAEAEIKPSSPHANNMMAPYYAKTVKTAYAVNVTIPQNVGDGDYLAFAVNGKHGVESAYCAAVIDGNPAGCDDRAVSYPINNWEHIVGVVDSHYTYYLNVTKDMAGKSAECFFLLTGEAGVTCDVYFCKGNIARTGVTVTV